MIGFDPAAFLEKRIEAAHNAKSIEEYRSIVNELLEHIKEFQQETVRLEEEIKQLKDTKALENEVEDNYKYPIVTRKSDNAKRPYCNTCYATKRIFNPMGGMSTPSGQFYDCGNCNNKFMVKSRDDIFMGA